MSKYRKKPVVIDAFQWLPNASANDIPDWFYQNVLRTDDVIDEDTGLVTIRTLEGDMQAQPGDYIIRGVAGEIYPCKPDIFRQTYEPVND